jgi:hypothetical protein
VINKPKPKPAPKEEPKPEETTESNDKMDEDQQPPLEEAEGEKKEMDLD